MFSRKTPLSIPRRAQRNARAYRAPNGDIRDDQPRTTLRHVTLAILAATALADPVWALSLGRATVQSILGEPLRAEIEVPSIDDTEAASLQVRIAPVERFRAANLEFQPLLQEVTLDVQRRAGGQAVIVLRSQRPVTEPFLDLVLQARWAGGELLRNYTLLFDPPHLQRQSPITPPVPAPAPMPAPTQASTAVREQARPAPVPRPGAAQPNGDQPQAQGTRVTVRRGDTAGKIAAAHKPADVTMEQMLVAMLRHNPQAFVRNNVHLLRAGAVIDMPDAAVASEIDAREARRLVAAQARDFNEYRRRLAAAAPRQEAPEASRAAAGVVESAIAEAKPQAAAQDKLTLTKPGDAARTEAAIAEQRQRSDSEQRVAELNRNLTELQQLQQAVQQPPASPAAAPAATGATTSTPPATDPSKPADSPASTDPVQAPGTSAPAAAAEAAPPAPPAPAAAAPATAAPKPTPPVPAPAHEEPGIFASLLDNPLVAPAGGGVAALLAALFWWRTRQRRQTATPAESPSELRVDPVGSEVEMKDEAPSSSMLYSPSQLDAGGEIDPVAEAEVYLAYGREQQAEEILLEALRTHPDRLPVRLKLLEIYAQRPDAARFESQARELHALTQGRGPEWARACEWGITLDPNNPLYRQAMSTAPAPAPEVTAAVTEPNQRVAEVGNTADSDTADSNTGDSSRQPDEPLDFDISVEPTEAAPDTSAPPTTPASEPPQTLDLDFDLDLAPSPSAGAERSAAPAPSRVDEVLTLSVPPELDAGSEGVTVTEEATLAVPSEVSVDDALSSLEIPEGLGEADPLETKLSLAREFEAIGDIDGARTLAEEVVAEATGELQERARAFLAQLA
ncbi:FimV/HubP family polar landmark protein [Tepidimonas taiwanensis]|uniref:FimV/HubP family polar landmark protein n=1 Tax=Tepidimonas taiwanensis TaxID=307486 RepID=UPI000AF5656C|nr:FimV/HubP family polar landmark protein [Tepidimonas taiwanensis]